ncbi:MAG: hypothetical protein QG675_534, partial [Patescibacteria group bacterium]|nr:hypothetical protein [Patescibacteria group bacterium]
MAQTKTETITTSYVDTRWFYRILEIIPGSITWTLLTAPILLSFFYPVAVAYFIIAFDIFWLLKSIRMSFSLVRGHQRSQEAASINWTDRLIELSNVEKSLSHVNAQLELAIERHAPKPYVNKLKKEVDRLELLVEHQTVLFDPTRITHCIIMPLYNESIDVIRPAIQALAKSNYNLKKILFVFSYEQRGGSGSKETAKQLEKEFGKTFGEYITYMHPDGIVGELKGKGANISFAGKKILQNIKKRGISPHDVVVTTLDCDHRVHPDYLSCLTYAYCTNPNRRHSSFQPLALFNNNIWDVPAPMRVIATSNSFWVMIESVRQGRLRNFASHAQSLDALEDTDFWSITSPVEDGHQFYRSYFTFNGNYMVEPLFIPIYQDAVLASSYPRTFVAQFKQLQRWAYGVSDFPYVVKNSIKNKEIPLGNKLIQIG